MLTNRDGNLILIWEEGSRLAAKGKGESGSKNAGVFAFDRTERQKTAWDSVIDAAGSTGRLHNTQDIRQEHLSERE